MFPKDIVDKLEAIDVDLSIFDKLSKFEQWKNETGIQENSPASLDMFSKYLKENS